ncbi:MAG: mannose-1-phosphate guanylyltransferase/mannose-6-phosphate isomerase [Gammaproteobacteria bacterium]|nr:mannose-1-phosphate guanylyltransferase/mannose-6-phosphate isomerase [Gammaproteobacteria bacterium]
MSIQPVILSGGSGTRLWPLSRELYPKQLLPLVSDNSMLQDTLLRLYKKPASSGVSSLAGITIEPPIIVSNNEHRFLVAEQLRQIGIANGRIFLEPVGRNTAPALTLAALSCDADSILLVMPADHVILDTGKFASACMTANALAEGNWLVTFGIVPRHAETGYGYIKKGGELPGNNPQNPVPCVIDQFVEKPDFETAQRYIESGSYLWNSGMFMLKASVWLKQLERFRPDILRACRQAFNQGKKDLDFFRADTAAFANCPSDSIDYAVMEKVAGNANAGNDVSAAVVPLDAGWSDVGAWSSLWEVGNQDEQGNVIKGDVKTHDVTGSFLYAEHRFVAGVGIKDLVVVETADAVLVADKQRAQDVKKIVEWLKEQERDERLVHRQVYRPWGSYEGVTAGDRFQVKRIVVNPGASLSLQMHHHRAEHWIVVKGTAKVTRGGEVFLITENQSTYIPLGEKHRLENPGTVPLEIIEVQSGTYLGEDDIVRFEDNYGRGP